MTKKLMEIFKPGRFTDMNGRTINFTEADLIATAKAYDPAIHEAPLVIGHPGHDAPAYGWVKGLTFAEQLLLSDNGQVDADFAEMVNSGKFKHKSASFYLPDAPNNPVPGVYYLRHIGFLGAQPPAVKGLKAASFADNEQGVVCFGDWNDRLIARMFRNLKNYLIGAVGQEQADKVLDEWDLQSITEEAVNHDQPESAISYAEKEAEMNRIQELETQLAAAKSEIVSFKEQLLAKDTQIATITTELATINGKTRRAECAAFCDTLPTKISPAMRPTVIEMMLKLDSAPPLEFGEGDAKTTRSALDVYQAELQAAPDVVAFSEQATGSRVGEGNRTAVDAAEFGENVDQDRLGLHGKILQFMETNPDKTYEQALVIVQKQD